MKPADGIARSDAPCATLAAGLTLVACETVNALAGGGGHPPLYLGLSAGFTLALALAVGAPLALFRASAGFALAGWAAAGGWFCAGWPAALALGGAALGASRLRRVGATRPSVLGTCAALGFALALLRGPSIAERLGRPASAPLEALGAALLFGAFFGGVPLFLSFVPPRVTSGPRLAALLSAGLLLSARPALERPDGLQRLPPAGYAGSAPRVPGPRGPDVFLLVLDTVRADHLTMYGYERDTTPELDRWVQRRANSAVFPRAYANATWTVPSHASLFTGRLPHEHGAHFALDGSLRLAFGIEEQLPTLAERLRSLGYATLGGCANNWLATVKGMDRGFERYLMAPETEALPFVGEALRRRFVPGIHPQATKGGACASAVNTTLLSLIEPWSRGPNPLFVFANYGDAHGPYAPPPPFRGRFAPADRHEPAEHLSLALSPERRSVLQARYDEELCYLDHELGKLLGELEALGLLERSWVFVTADHGEAFGEHGVLEHGTTVFDEVVHIPLIVFPPAGQVLPVDPGPVSLVDVAATIAAIGGSELPGPGRDLRAPRSGDVPAAIEFYGDPSKAALQGELARHPARSVVLGRWKLIELDDSIALYDLDNDEGEHVNLANALPELARHLRALLPPFAEPVRLGGPDGVHDDVLERLRGLGYVGAE